MCPSDRTELSPEEMEPVPVEAWAHWLVQQYAQCSADIRQVDALVWQIPAAIGAIGTLLALTFAAAGGTGARDVSVPQIGIAVVAMAITFSLLIGLHKNRLFQIQRSRYRLVLHVAYLRAARLPSGSPVSPVLPDPGHVAGADVDDLHLFGIFPSTSKKQPCPTHGRVDSLIWGVSAYDFLASMSLVVAVAELAYLGWLVTRMWV